MRENLPVRKNIRLKDYDYSRNGAYFITFCIKDKHELLWESVGAHIVRPPLSPDMRPPLSDIGRIVETAIKNIPIIYKNTQADKYVIMPNHIHLILCIYDENGRTMCAPTISRVVKQCKEYVIKQIGYSIWQKSFHDHIIRNEAEYQKIWSYIEENPVKWTEDCYYTL